MQWAGAAVYGGLSSPITVFDLIRGETCLFEVRATNAIGPGPFSALSNPVTGQ